MIALVFYVAGQATAPTSQTWDVVLVAFSAGLASLAIICAFVYFVMRLMLDSTTARILALEQAHAKHDEDDEKAYARIYDELRDIRALLAGEARTPMPAERRG